MRYIAALVVLGILSAVPCVGQSSQSDSQTLQAILVELRGMHNDIRLSQTTQILLAEMQMQQAAVNRAQQKRDDLRNIVSQLQTQQKSMTEQLARFDERANAELDPVQKKQLTQVQGDFKSQIATLKAQEPDRANELADAESRLVKEQDALNSIQDQLNAVVKKLQPAASQ
jgi:hypothetical protein